MKKTLKRILFIVESSLYLGARALTPEQIEAFKWACQALEEIIKNLPDEET